MKKIISAILFGVLLLIISISKVQAQTPSFSPAKFTAEDQVTLTVNVTGTPVENIDQAYIWIWCNPSGTGTSFTSIPDGGGNGISASWNPLSTPDLVKMTNVGTNLWSYTFVGTTIFGTTPSELHDFGFLVRNIDGSKQTPDIKPFKFDPLVFTPTMLRVFPANVDTTDVVALNFDQSLATATNDQRMLPTSVTVTAYDEEATPAQIGSPITVPVINTSGSIWTGVFIPSANFTTAANGHKLAGFKYNFNGTVLDPNGNPATVSTAQSDLVGFTSMK